ncbi:MAG: hypothetical protein H7X80_09365, partial [bacterium]|nr:hypothetical protein [Candidatus Kapabacteria bacterium]
MKSFVTMLGSVVLVAVCVIAGTDVARAQYQRIVLLEEHTSVTCGPCAAAGRNLNDAVSNDPTRTVSIRYHNNFVGPKDRFFEANKTENAARHSYYGWQSMPRVRVNGSIDIQGTDRTELNARISDELAIESPIKVEVTQVAQGIDRIVTVKVTAGSDGLASGKRLYAAAVEARVHEPLFQNSPYNGEVDVHDIMRDMIPNVDGEALTLAPNEVKNFVYSY